MDELSDDLQVTIDRILPKGIGIGHVNGLTVMVPLTAAGDIVKVRVRSVKGRIVFAEVVELVSRGPDRIEPPCRYYGECGGCDLQHLEYRAQLRTKLGIIRDCFDRIGRFVYPEPTIIENIREFGYRSRARVHFDRSTGNVGFHRRDSNETIDVESCLVLDAVVHSGYDELRRDLNQLLKRGITEVDIVNTDDGPLMSGDATPQLGSISVGDFRYQFGATSFFQGSRSMIEKLVEIATDGILDRNCLDLYSGVGLFSLPLARKNRSVIAVESNDKAVEFARLNAQFNGVAKISVIGDKVFRYLKNVRPSVDAIVVDPPRIGLERGVAERIAQIRPEIISYVSCEPSTLARDLRIFVDHGFTIEKVTAIDLFPQTHHIETVVRLCRT